MRLPGSSSAADAVAAARTAADDVVAAAAAAASRPRYTCEPATEARIVDGAVVDPGSPASNAARGGPGASTPPPERPGTTWYVNGPGAAEIAQQNPLQACREQTGMTTAECQADAAAGNAS